MTAPGRPLPIARPVAAMPGRRCLHATGGQAALGLLSRRMQPADAQTAHDPFIERLFGQMTLVEKAGQLGIFFDHAREDAPNVNLARTEKTGRPLALPELACFTIR